MVRPDPSLWPLRVVACADKSREKAEGTAGLEGMQVVLTVWKKLCRSDAPRAERPPAFAVYGLSRYVA